MTENIHGRIEHMKKIIIIGAGPAGITAGFELLKQSKEYEVIILEESQEVGGISRTVRYLSLIHI